jgi:hypothetical protein
MRFFMRWVVSSLAAWGLQHLTNYLLPEDLGRFWVILIAGSVGILWLNLIDKPIRKAFP